MVLNNTNGSTTTCPDCGNEMPLVSWVGEQPVCASCAGATTTSFEPLTELSLNDDTGCLHDDLDEDATHMIACNCPMCQPRC